MKIVVNILKGIGFGLFKIHLWLPALYSLVFLVVKLTAGVGSGIGYAIGLIIALVGSVALTYYMTHRKVKNGDFLAGEKKLHSAATPEQEQPAQLLSRTMPQPVQTYAPAPQPVYAPPQPVQPAYDPSRDLYASNFMQTPQRASAAAQLGYNPHAALYDNNYAQPNRVYEQDYDPRAALYGNAYSAGEDRMSADVARANLYAPEPDHGAVYASRDDAAAALYPAASAAREALDRGDASAALYPKQEKADLGGYDRTAASGALYHQSGNAEYKTFSPYMQPVNSILPGRSQPAQLYDAPKEPEFDREAELRRHDEEFMAAANLADAQPVHASRRREAPIQIFATKSDENTYVYEYADRFEFIKLLDDGNKELLKTDFKN